MSYFHLNFCRMERSTGLYFNMKYFEKMVIDGKWDAAEQYLAGFTSIEDNGSSLKMYFEIRKQKYLEALDRFATRLRSSS